MRDRSQTACVLAVSIARFLYWNASIIPHETQPDPMHFAKSLAFLSSPSLCRGSLPSFSPTLPSTSAVCLDMFYRGAVLSYEVRG